MPQRLLRCLKTQVFTHRIIPLFFSWHWYTYSCFVQVTKLLEKKQNMSRFCDPGSTVGGLFGSLLAGLGERAVQVTLTAPPQCHVAHIWLPFPKSYLLIHIVTCIQEGLVDRLQELGVAGGQVYCDKTCVKTCVIFYSLCVCLIGGQAFRNKMIFCIYQTDA